MSKKNNKIIVKYRFPEGYCEEYNNVEIDIDFDTSNPDRFKRVSKPGFNIETIAYQCFEGQYSRKIEVGGSNIKEVIFQNFDFTMSKKCDSTSYAVRDGVMLTFDHCKFQEFVPDYSGNPYQRCDGIIVFGHCLADYVKVYLAEFWMLVKNRIYGSCEISHGDLCMVGDVQMKRLKVQGKSTVRVHAEKAKLKIPTIDIDANTIQLINSVVDATSLGFSYDTLEIEHTDFSARKYQFNDDVWKFKKKTPISTDDPQNEQHLARARFLQVAKNLCQIANTANEMEANQYFTQMDEKSAKRIDGYRRQIVQLESMITQEERWNAKEKEQVGKTLLKRNAGSVLPSRPKS